MSSSLSISPAELSQAMYAAQQAPRTYMGAGSPAFTGQGLQSPACDQFQSSRGFQVPEKEGLPWGKIIMGVAAIGGLIYLCSKGKDGTSGWQKVKNFFTGSAASEATKGVGAAKTKIMEMLPESQKKALQIAQQTRNATYTDSIKGLVKKYGINETEAFEALKKCTNVSEMEAKLIELSGKSNVTTKLTAESRDVLDALNPWLNATNKYNGIKKPIRELSERVAELSPEYLKNMRTGEFGGVDERVRKLISSQDAEFQKEIFRLADEGKYNEIAEKLNGISGKESILGSARVDADKLKPWTDASQKYASNNYELTLAQVENALKSNEQYITGYTSKFSEEEMIKLNELIKDKPIQEAVVEIKGGTARLYGTVWTPIEDIAKITS